MTSKEQHTQVDVDEVAPSIHLKVEADDSSDADAGLAAGTALAPVEQTSTPASTETIREAPPRLKEIQRHKAEKLTAETQPKQPALLRAPYIRRLAAACLDSMVIASIGVPVILGAVQCDSLMRYGHAADMFVSPNPEMMLYVIVYAVLIYGFEGLVPMLFPLFVTALSWRPLSTGVPFTDGLEYLFFFALMPFLINACYHARMESSVRQATLGKRLTGIVVANEAGARISFRRALSRHLLKSTLALSYFICLAQEIWRRLSNLRGKGDSSRAPFRFLHDRFAGTAVFEGLVGKGGGLAPVPGRKFQMRSNIVVQLCVCLTLIVVGNLWGVAALEQTVDAVQLRLFENQAGIYSEAASQARNGYLDRAFQRGCLIAGASELERIIALEEARKPVSKERLANLLIQLGLVFDEDNKTDDAITTLDRAFALINSHHLQFPASVARKEAYYIPLYKMHALELSKFEMEQVGFRLALLKEQKSGALWDKGDFAGAQTLRGEAFNLMERYIAGKNDGDLSSIETTDRLKKLTTLAHTWSQDFVRKGQFAEIQAGKVRVLKILDSVPYSSRDPGFDRMRKDFLKDMEWDIKVANRNKLRMEQQSQRDSEVDAKGKDSTDLKD